MSDAQPEQQAPPSVALIISDDDAHAFLLECLVHDDVDVVIHLDSPREAIDLVLAGTRPSVVLVDVELYRRHGDVAAVTAALRIVADTAVVLEVGERIEPSGEMLRQCLRGNSLEVSEWTSLRG